MHRAHLAYPTGERGGETLGALAPTLGLDLRNRLAIHMNAVGFAVGWSAAAEGGRERLLGGIVAGGVDRALRRSQMGARRRRGGGRHVTNQRSAQVGGRQRVEA